jgi:hypothetical protein
MAPHCGQRATASGAPQALQNLAFGGLSCRQKPHSMGDMDASSNPLSSG